MRTVLHVCSHFTNVLIKTNNLLTTKVSNNRPTLKTYLSKLLLFSSLKNDQNSSNENKLR